jgi:hypothetical protein
MAFFLVEYDRMIPNKTQNTPHSSGQDVLIPVPPRNKRKEIRTIVEINSRDRNYKSYPNASEFRWRLYRPMKDVTQIQIVGGTIPACNFNLNRPWNSFTFLEGTSRTNLTFSPGRYNYENLVASLASLLNSRPGAANQYTVSVNTTTGLLTLTRISGAATFGFLFTTGDYVDFYDQNNTLQKINSPARLLGFGRDDYLSNAAGQLISPFVVDLDFILTRMYLYINHDNNQDLNLIERSVGRLHPHAIIYIDQIYNNYKFLNKETFEPLFLSYPAPISRISNLDIALRDEFDRLVDLNGRDFTLLLEITSLE